MKVELIIIAITAFLILNTYYDGKYMRYFQIGTKYMKIATIGFIGLSALLFLRKYPNEKREFFKYASEMVKFMPIDRNASASILPMLDFINPNSQNGNAIQATQVGNAIQGAQNGNAGVYGGLDGRQQRMLQSGGNTNKRVVSESKKKYVASSQGWKCAGCNSVLDATFEVDHKIPLYKGGTNQVDNLEALCRNCHGKKTLNDRLS